MDYERLHLNIFKSGRNTKVLLYVPSLTIFMHTPDKNVRLSLNQIDAT